MSSCRLAGWSAALLLSLIFFFFTGSNGSSLSRYDLDLQDDQQLFPLNGLYDANNGYDDDDNEDVENDAIRAALKERLKTIYRQYLKELKMAQERPSRLHESDLDQQEQEQEIDKTIQTKEIYLKPDKRGRFQGFCFRRTKSGRRLPYVCWRSTDS